MTAWCPDSPSLSGWEYAAFVGQPIDLSSTLVHSKLSLQLPAMKCHLDICIGPQKIIRNDIRDPVTFILALQPGQNFPRHGLLEDKLLHLTPLLMRL